MNIRHGGGDRVPRIISFLAALSPDTVVLTEYRANEKGVFISENLRAQGYGWQAASSVEPKQNCVYIASKHPFAVVASGADAEIDSHRVLVAQFKSFDIVGVYFPQNEAKRPVFTHLRTNLLPRIGVAGVVIGDFNTGKPFEDEAGKTFSCSDCFSELLASGLIDSWRIRNSEAREFTWFSHAGNGFRVDHALCTKAFDSRIQSVAYLHKCREDGTTDHSAMLVEHDA
ncbi:MAG TPA: hypothetical protein PKH05_16705 [Nitrospira sp.]|nr:hypothetical protein [Nitrospira sp.]